MMTTGTNDGNAVTIEVKENGHQHSTGDSENGAKKDNESSNIQITTKEDKQEAAAAPEEMEIGEHFYLMHWLCSCLKGLTQLRKSRRIYPKYMPKCSVGSTDHVCKFLLKKIA